MPAIAKAHCIEGLNTYPNTNLNPNPNSNSNRRYNGPSL